MVVARVPMLRKIAGYVVVAAVTAVIVVVVVSPRQPRENASVSLDQLLESMIVESEDERAALQLILTGDPDKIEQGPRHTGRCRPFRAADGTKALGNLLGPFKRDRQTRTGCTSGFSSLSPAPGESIGSPKAMPRSTISCF